MSEDPPRRKTLSLKPGVVVTRPLGPEPLRPIKPAKPPKPEPPPAPTFGWKCKPCGKGFDPPEGAADEETVRCPNCNARIGLVGDFKQDPPPNRLRARPVKR
jgi:DNA-directed RNA polymerase subunit RPC12/RpoP